MHAIRASLLFLVFTLPACGNVYRPPNIILIMADDLGYGDLGCYGQSLVQTPHIDRLAAEGIRFKSAYAGSTVCAPSRCVLMTGRHTGHAAVRDNVPHYASYLQDCDVTVAEVLARAGYRCGGVGKWSLGDAGTVGRPTRQGFDMWLGYLNQDHAHYYFTEYLDDGEGRLELRGNAETRHTYSHDLFTGRALDFIEASCNGPFFLYAAYTLPHFSSRDEDPHGLAVPSTRPYSDRGWDERSKKYAAMIHLLDESVGRIVKRVDELGLRERTLIIFTSDNGPNANVPPRFDPNGPLRGYKRDLTEGGLRVPFVARWTGTIPANRTSDEVIAFQDMMPTFAELSGARPPADADGISVVSALLGEKLESTREFLYWDYGHCRSRYDQAVRLGNYKAIRHGVEGKIQLYDLSEDLGETRDLATTFPGVVQGIARIMEQAATPSERYPIGRIYSGGPLWKRDPTTPSAHAIGREK